MSGAATGDAGRGRKVNYEKEGGRSVIPLVALERQFHALRDRLLADIGKVIDSGHYILGPNVGRLESELREKLQTAEAVTVANGTDALVLVLEAYGIGGGDEVITTPFTFVATAEAVSRVGAVPVFADVDPLTYNLDPAGIERRLTSRTKAIMPVHLFGQPAEMDAIRAIADAHGLIVIEDACQAIGSTYRGRPAGSLGDAACFSFFPTKNLGTMGDGGLVTTSDPEIAARVRKLRHHGSTRKYFHDAVGYNSRLDELHAAILLVMLEHLDEWNDRRREHAARYREGLAGIPELILPHEADDRRHIYHLFCLQSTRREALMHRLREAGIDCGIYYPCPLHLQQVYAGLGYRKGDLPVAEALSERLFAVPMSPMLTEEERSRVIEALKGGVAGT